MAVRELDVSPRTRRAVHVFLLVFALTGVAHLELFPFSGFRLFSEVRDDQRTSWELRAVDAEGHELEIDVDHLPLGYRQAKRLIATMDELDAPARDALCDAWTTPLRESGVDVVRLRIYRTVANVRPEASRAERALQYECGGEAP